MKSHYQNTRSKKRLAIFLIKLATRGEIIQINLKQLLEEIFNETGEIFAKTEHGDFESFFIVDSDELCNPEDKVNGCGDGYNVQKGICTSILHMPIAPILIPSIVDEVPLWKDMNQFPGNLITICGILPTVKPLPGLKKNLLVKFRRDFGMKKHWPKSIKYSKFVIKNLASGDKNDGICYIII